MATNGNLKASFNATTLKTYDDFRRANRASLPKNPLDIHGELGRVRNRLLRKYRGLGLSRESFLTLDLYFCRLLGGGNRAED